MDLSEIVSVPSDFVMLKEIIRGDEVLLNLSRNSRMNKNIPPGLLPLNFNLS